MKSTRYFEEIVRKKRPYIKLEWIESVVKNPIKVETQSDDRIRFWGYVKELEKYIRVITLSDRETIHNVFPDRNFKE
jgi:hypothetical protein